MSAKESKNEEKKPIVIKNATDLQRLKLEKLMKNPDKPVMIPEPPKQKSLTAPPDFVRNVMGSSAGAGSGEFHVYRHLRRKEYARQKFIQEKSEKEKLDDEYHNKIEVNRRLAEERTAKKRAKRLKKKKITKSKGKKAKSEPNVSQSDSSSDKEEYKDLDTKSEDNDIAEKISEDFNVRKDIEGGKDTKVNNDAEQMTEDENEKHKKVENVKENIEAEKQGAADDEKAKQTSQVM